MKLLRNAFQFGALSLVLLGGSGPLAAVPPAKPLKVGQEWHYRTRKGEDKSTLVILQVDPGAPGKRLVHVSVRGLRIANTRTPGTFMTEVLHIPITEVALRRSLTTLAADSVTLPDYLATYKEWRAAMDRGQASAFDVSVADALDFVDATLSLGH
jgi:hypothetical protein